MLLQIDLRFVNPEEGDLEVVVAPVMRFKDIDFNANVKIEDIAPPERIISGFALEIFGSPLAVSKESHECIRPKLASNCITPGLPYRRLALRICPAVHPLTALLFEFLCLFAGR